jgi:hypothetical protein
MLPACVAFCPDDPQLRRRLRFLNSFATSAWRRSMRRATPNLTACAVTSAPSGTRRLPVLHIAGTKEGSTARTWPGATREPATGRAVCVAPPVDMRGHPPRRGLVSERDHADGGDGARLAAEGDYFETMTRRPSSCSPKGRGLRWSRWAWGPPDATNVILPAACAITTIDYDHMEKLGKADADRREGGDPEARGAAVSNPAPKPAGCWHPTLQNRRSILRRRKIDRLPRSLLSAL